MRRFQPIFLLTMTLALAAPTRAAGPHPHGHKARRAATLALITAGAVAITSPLWAPPLTYGPDRTNEIPAPANAPELVRHETLRSAPDSPARAAERDRQAQLQVFALSFDKWRTQYPRDYATLLPAAEEAQALIQKGQTPTPDAWLSATLRRLQFGPETASLELLDRLIVADARVNPAEFKPGELEDLTQTLRTFSPARYELLALSDGIWVNKLDESIEGESLGHHWTRVGRGASAMGASLAKFRRGLDRLMHANP
jgi:hypothetical protein